MSASAPSPPSTITEVNELNGDIGTDRTERDSKGSVPGNGGHFVFTEDDERKFAEKMERDRDIENEAVNGVHVQRSRKQSITFSTAPFSPSMGSVPPLSQVTIDYVEMEDKVNRLIQILITKEDRIEDMNAVYTECEITAYDLREGLPSWVDLLCTHSDLFHETALVKTVNKENAFWAPLDDDDEVREEHFGDDRDLDPDDIVEGDGSTLYSENETYHYSVFERLLFELSLHFLYFIYDIGIEAESAFNEQHPSSLFILSGNIVQILKKCSPVLHSDISTFYAEILAPYSLQIRYRYLNDATKWRTVPMVKYLDDGIQNDYNFVGRVQFEEMLDRHPSTGLPVKSASYRKYSDDEDVDPDEHSEDDAEDVMSSVPTKYDSDLTYEVIVNGDTVKDLVIYKSVIPGIFTVSSPLKVTNLKRTMSIPSMVLNAECHLECEKWNEEGDYYGFIRLNVMRDLVINGSSTISASESGYCNGHGPGIGHFKNDRKSKTKFSSGGGYGTASESPHPECPEGAVYGEDCIERNYLYYGSPCADATERGGGIIDILCRRKFVNFGCIECKGSSGLHFGGSSGGSIRIVADYFVNYGTITAEGGKGALYQRPGSKRKQLGTDGGDGRIFIICRRFENKGTITPKPIIITTDDTTKYGFASIKSLNENTTF